jgi:hypothetical protein
MLAQSGAGDGLPQSELPLGVGADPVVSLASPHWAATHVLLP